MKTMLFKEAFSYIKVRESDLITFMPLIIIGIQNTNILNLS